ncbi:protein-L-isoaspartate O-methyltransferase [bacterium]|nr:protein-L-isoaspartate O-methyltransferase [bacterium]
MEKRDLVAKLKKDGYDKKITQAFLKVKREDFIPLDYQRYSYEDAALPIGREQNISQPSTIAFMLSLLNINNSQKILEIGVGSGYALALISEMTRNSKVYGTERLQNFVDLAKSRLKNNKKIEIFYTPNNLGLAEKSPFNRILVSASSPELPEILVGQLAEDGIIVCPINNSIVKAVKKEGEMILEEFPDFHFVPLIYPYSQ